MYVDGGWDMFHAGHVAFLAARARGDYLLVGVHNDAVVNRHRGRNFPLLNLNERVLSVLACKHVDDVLIDPPWHMTREMVAALRIAVVAHGTTHDANDDGGRDPYEAPKALGVYASSWRRAARSPSTRSSSGSTPTTSASPPRCRRRW